MSDDHDEAAEFRREVGAHAPPGLQRARLVYDLRSHLGVDAEELRTMTYGDLVARLAARRRATEDDGGA